MKALKILGTIIAVMVLLTLYGEYIGRHGNPIAMTPPAVSTATVAPVDPRITKYCAGLHAFGVEVATSRNSGTTADAWRENIAQGTNPDYLKERYDGMVTMIYSMPDKAPEFIGSAIESACLESTFE